MNKTKYEEMRRKLLSVEEENHKLRERNTELERIYEYQDERIDGLRALDTRNTREMIAMKDEIISLKQARERAERVSLLMAKQMIEFNECGFIVLETGEGEDEHTINTVEELIDVYQKEAEQKVESEEDGI